jgi:hypothetical protein
VDQPRAVLLLASHPQTLSDNRPGIKCLRTESRDETGKALDEMLEAAAADNLGATALDPLARTVHWAVLLVSGRPSVRIRSQAPSSAGV